MHHSWLEALLGFVKLAEPHVGCLTEGFICIISCSASGEAFLIERFYPFDYSLPISGKIYVFVAVI